MKKNAYYDAVINTLFINAEEKKNLLEFITKSIINRRKTKNKTSHFFLDLSLSLSADAGFFVFVDADLSDSGSADVPAD